MCVCVRGASIFFFLIIEFWILANRLSSPLDSFPLAILINSFFFCFSLSNNFSISCSCFSFLLFLESIYVFLHFLWIFIIIFLFTIIFCASFILSHLFPYVSPHFSFIFHSRFLFSLKKSYKHGFPFILSFRLSFYKIIFIFLFSVVRFVYLYSLLCLAFIPLFFFNLFSSSFVFFLAISSERSDFTFKMHVISQDSPIKHILCLKIFPFKAEISGSKKSNRVRFNAAVKNG